MRAYLLGYNHGTSDGYHSTLIERGGCEKAYDESLDVEYVELEKVLKIIEEMKYDIAKDVHEGLWNERVNLAKYDILDLKGGKQDA